MTKPLICFLAPKPTGEFGEWYDQNSHWDWMFIKPGDDLFASLGDRLPAAIINSDPAVAHSDSHTQPAYSQLSKLPGFALARWLLNPSFTDLDVFVKKLQFKSRPIYYISDVLPRHTLQWATHLTFGQFYSQCQTIQEADLFFDAKLQTTINNRGGPMWNFAKNVWPNLSQFRGFVNTFMHLIEQDMTPQIELQMFAMARGLQHIYYPDLNSKSIGTFFEFPQEVHYPDLNPKPSAPFNEPPVESKQSLEQHVLKLSRVIEKHNVEIATLQDAILVFFFHRFFCKVKKLLGYWE